MEPILTKPTRRISRKLQVEVFYRDRWLCHWCGRPLVFAPAMKLLQLDLQAAGYAELAYWRYAYDRNGAPLLDELAAVIDHVTPFSEGGLGSLENLTSACNRCNMRKNNSDSKRWAKEHPLTRIKAKRGEPTAWEGFTNLFLLLAARYPASLTKTEKEWFEVLQEVRKQRV
jgi:hypothetical protein